MLGNVRLSSQEESILKSLSKQRITVKPEASDSKTKGYFRQALYLCLEKNTTKNEGATKRISGIL